MCMSVFLSQVTHASSVIVRTDKSLADFRDLLAAASSCGITKVISREINEREDEMFLMFLMFLIKAVK